MDVKDRDRQSGGYEDFCAFFRTATGNDPYPYQREFAEGVHCPSAVNVPTGLGKTAMSVLGWLWRLRFHTEAGVRACTPRRLVYCLPMRILAEQTRDEVEQWLENLGHAGAGIGVHLFMGGVAREDWTLYPERDAILIGTQDMLLSRALNRGYAASRARWPIEFGLLHNDACWVFDEVQLMGNGLACGAQLESFRKNVWGHFGHTRSVWVSATLQTKWLETPDHKIADDSGGVLTLTSADRDQLSVKTRLNALKILQEPLEWSKNAGALAATIADAHREVQSSVGRGVMTLVVVNTVDRARDIHQAVSKAVASKGGRKPQARRTSC